MHCPACVRQFIAFADQLLLLRPGWLTHGIATALDFSLWPKCEVPTAPENVCCQGDSVEKVGEVDR